MEIYPGFSFLNINGTPTNSFGLSAKNVIFILLSEYHIKIMSLSASPGEPHAALEAMSLYVGSLKWFR